MPRDDERLKVFVWKTSDGEPVIDITNDAGDLSEEFDILDSLDEPTAHRLVGAWNACQGVPTARLEGLDVGALLGAAEAALKYIETCCEPTCNEGDEFEDGSIDDGSHPDANLLRAALGIPVPRSAPAPEGED